MFNIYAYEKATGDRFVLCCNAGVWWFAWSGLLKADLPLKKAEEKLDELAAQQLVRLFRERNNDVVGECETVNLASFRLKLERAG